MRYFKLLEASRLVGKAPYRRLSVLVLFSSVILILLLLISLRPPFINENDMYLKNMTIVKPLNRSSAVLLMSGIIYKNGPISLKKFYLLKNRTPELPTPGSYSVVTLDWRGQTIDKIPFRVAFYILVEPYGPVETNVTGFSFTIPFPDNVSKILIQYNNTVLLEINPNTKLLHDAVDSIPDYGFIDNPGQRRRALHNEIDALEKMLEEGKIKGAIEKLKEDIRDKLVKWLVDYKVENPLQLTKDEVISLVDEIIYRLSLQLPQRG